MIDIGDAMKEPILTNEDAYRLKCLGFIKEIAESDLKNVPKSQWVTLIDLLDQVVYIIKESHNND